MYKSLKMSTEANDQLSTDVCKITLTIPRETLIGMSQYKVDHSMLTEQDVARLAIGLLLKNNGYPKTIPSIQSQSKI